MNIPLTPIILGDLIEKGFTYMLAGSKTEPFSTDSSSIRLKPLKHKPELPNLPEGYETFYKITREPMQMACGIDQIEVTIEYEPLIEDITGEDIVEDRYFRMSEDFFRQVLDSLEDYAVVTTDTNGDINSWNTGAEKLLGYKEKEILGLSASVFFTPEDVANGAPERELTNALTNGRAIDERYHMRKGELRFWGSGLVFPLYDDGHQHRGFTKIMRNLKEERQAQSQSLF